MTTGIVMDWKKLLSRERIRQSSSAAMGDRSSFEQDYDRIIFSKPFRRLQKKTQVFPLPEHDFIHTRLTHSLETSSVGRSLGMYAGQAILKQFPEFQNEFVAHDFAAIVAAAALAHDLGNPPFGHSGEDAISDFFKSPEGEMLIKDLNPLQKMDLQNFEGNAMGFRLLGHTLPGVSSNEGGLNLTCATLGAFLKYPCEIMTNKFPGASGKKYGFFQSQKELFKKVVDTLGMKRKEGTQDTLAYYRHPLAFLVEAADDISYLIMDLEDGYNLKLIEEKVIKDALSSLLSEGYNETVFDKIYDPREQVAFLRARAIGSLIYQIKEVFEKNLTEIIDGKYDKSLVKDIEIYDALQEMEKICREKVYRYRKVLEIEAAGFEVIGGLLGEFISSLQEKTKKAEKIKSLLPPHYIGKNLDTPDQRYEAILQIVQFVAGMTDTFAIDTYVL